MCSIAGSTVSFIGAGTCVIDADQAGNANYNAAPRAQQTFAVGKGSQTISFTSTAPANAVVGGAAYTVAATATSGLPVTFSVDPGASGICSIAGASVSFQHAGTCVLNADQAGNTVSVVIQRLCQSTGSPSSGAGCAVSPTVTGTESSSKGSGVIPLQVANQVYYRITARVAGPRNTVSYVQAVVAM